jgi:hypothetical protein
LRYTVLTKDWGINEKISPVIYNYPNSNASAYIENMIRKSFIDYHEDYKKSDRRISDIIKPIVDSFGLLYYTKPYQGRMHRDGKFYDVIFYNEREWRFVPIKKFHRIDKRPENIFQKPVEERRYRDNFRNEFESSPLRFEPSDVRYIIILRELEVLDMVKKIGDIKTSRDNKELLISKIISLEKIKDDF